MALTTKQKNYIRNNRSSKSAEKIARELKVDISAVQEFLKSIEPEKSPSKTKETQISGKKKMAFIGVMLAIPILFFLILEAGLRIADYRGNLDLFIKPEVFDGRIVIPNPEFTGRYFFNVRTMPNPSTDTFLAVKPENGYRVFVMGGSTTNGYPYGYNATFSRVFRDILQDTAPDRYIEVINVATSAINTYTLYDQIDEILSFEPDLILIYSGHNEYYGALGVGSSETFGAFPGFIRTFLKLQRYKTFLLVRDGITNFSAWLARIRGQQGTPTEGTLMQRMVGQQQIPLDGRLYELGKLQYQSNLNAIIRKFERRNVPVMLGSLTSNLIDQKPFISVPFENHPPADEVFQRAVRSFQAESFEVALEDFIYARDLDALRFRAPSSFNQIIQETSNRFSNVHYVPIKEAFQEASEHGLIGYNLMLEHLHPNYTGYHLMGMTFFEAFVEAGSPGIVLDLSKRSSPEEYMRRMYMTEYDKRVGDHRIKLLVNGWPFRDSPDPQGYPRNYRAFSLADSVAFSMVNTSIRWDLAKVRLAELYESRGMLNEALLEYRGLMREQLYNDSPFLRTARIFLDKGDLRNARTYLEQALDIEISAFGAKMLGAIEVDAGNLDRGIELLEAARSLEPLDPQTLFNLSGAYGLKNEFDKADEILKILEQTNPNFPGARAWRIQLNGHLRR